MQGVSVFISSGDSGVAGRGNGTADNGCLGPNMTIFSPDFPASCPYLTAVGGTVLPPGGDVTKDEEVAVTRFPSGGGMPFRRLSTIRVLLTSAGFSNIYPIPAYQANAVATYFRIDNPPYPYYSSINNNSFGANGGIYNRLGRGYPDGW